MNEEDRWEALGQELARAKREHEERSARHLTEHFLSQLSVALSPREDPALLGAVANALAGVTLEDWCRTGREDCAAPLALQEVWRTLENTWHWAAQEAEGEARMACFLECLAREDLEPLREELCAHAEALRGLASAARERPLMSPWPLEHQGSSRELHAQALEAIAERMELPREQLLAPEALEDEPLFLLAEEALPSEELASALARRVAWAHALYRLRALLPPAVATATVPFGSAG